MVRQIKYGPLIIITIALIVSMSYCAKNNDINIVPDAFSGSKICGVSFAAPPWEFGSIEMGPVANVNANFICFMPFAFGKFDSTELIFDNKFQWWGETSDGVKSSVGYAKEYGLNIMIKPHVWFSHGNFTGDFTLETEHDWKLFELNYKNYILHFARLADSLDVQMFCVGVEFKGFISERLEFWDHLIDTIKKVYKGKILYAANWDNYKNVPFWKKLDYIGIDAYFPLSGQKTPDVDSLKIAWEYYLNEIQSLSVLTGNQVIFTEYGYKSVNYAAFEPWNPTSEEVNLVAQRNAYEAQFGKVWDKPWFKGGFLWKWRANHPNAGGSENTNYTPQNKPAEETIRSYYSKYNKEKQ